MFKFLVPIWFYLAAFAISWAQESIVVDNVKFNSLRDNWVQMEVQISCRGNESPDARNKRFVENVKVKVYQVYAIDESARQYDFYTSEVEIVIMEQGDKNNVYFYMPGGIIERDQLQKVPDYYFVEISIGGEVQPPQKEGMSSSITNLQILESMRAKAEAEGGDNEFLLMPVYFAPAEYLGRVDKLPIFLRRDVRP